MINLTESAIKQINTIILQENDPKLKLRMYVQGGGCSGFSYGFELTDEQNDDDWQIPADPSSVLQNRPMINT